MRRVHILKAGITYCGLDGSKLPQGDQWISYKDYGVEATVRGETATEKALAKGGLQLCAGCTVAYESDNRK